LGLGTATSVPGYEVPRFMRECIRFGSQAYVQLIMNTINSVVKWFVLQKQEVGVRVLPDSNFHVFSQALGCTQTAFSVYNISRIGQPPHKKKLLHVC
jgi:hypothetical protein